MAGDIKGLVFSEGVTVSNPGSGIPGAETFAVGSIIQSILTLLQFQAEAGTSWVLLDGADITGSTLAGITGNNTLPDASGRFLRTVGGSAAALGLTQSDSTAKNGLSNASSSVSGSTDIDHDHSNFNSGSQSSNHSHTINHDHPATTTTSTNHTHNNVWQVEAGLSAGGNTFVGDTNSGDGTTSLPSGGSHSHSLNLPNYSGSSGSNSVSHTHAINVPNYNTSNRSLASGSATAQTITGDAETRPDNLSINTFIKIN